MSTLPMPHNAAFASLERTPNEGRLAGLAAGQSARVTAVLEPGACGERLLEMGLTPGTLVKVLRRGPFGDPVQLRVRGTLLTVRQAQATQVTVR